MKTFLSSELSKKLNGYEFVNTKDKQVNIQEEEQSEPKHVSLWSVVNCPQMETFLF